MSMDLSANNRINQLSEMIDNSPTKSLPAPKKNNVKRSQSTFTGGADFNAMLQGGSPDNRFQKFQ